MPNCDENCHRYAYRTIDKRGVFAKFEVYDTKTGRILARVIFESAAKKMTDHLNGGGKPVWLG